MDPDADLNVFTYAEARLHEGPHVDDLGRTVVTLRSSGLFASTFADRGFVAGPHRQTVVTNNRDPKLGEAISTTSASCSPRPPTPGYFSSYATIAAELWAMNNGTTIKTANIAGSAYSQRSVIAVQVGPLSIPRPPLPPRVAPTVYVLGTHHAREWIAQEVPLRLLRYYVDVANGVIQDSAVLAALQNTAVVFVPLVNPDGYEYSQTSYREQRKNRNPSCRTPAFSGVDINRNYNGQWSQYDDVDMSSDVPCDDIYVGASAASETETQGIQSLLTGVAMPNQIPAAAVSYHSYSDSIIYPPGLKDTQDVNGPKCTPNSNCLHPDFAVYRRLYGETNAPVRRSVDTGAPYQANQENNIFYTTSGAVENFAHTTLPIVTVEMTSANTNFYIECEPNYQGIVADELSQQKKLLRRLLSNALALVSSTETAAYGPRQFGKFSLGFLVREASGTATNAHDTARPQFDFGLWKPTAFPNFEVKVGSSYISTEKGRVGAMYDLRYVKLTNLNPSNPFCVPCEIEALNAKGVSIGGVASDCGSACVDLTDANRLPATQWSLISGARGGSADYWWEPNPTPSGDAILTVPGFPVPQNTLDCHLNFTTSWTRVYAPITPVILERKIGSNWTEVMRWPNEANPHSEVRMANRLRSESVESTLPSPAYGTNTDTFRFRVPAAATAPDFRLFDPIQLCHRTAN